LKSVLLSGATALLLASVGAAQTPTIRTSATGVVNNASYAPRGLPNSSIAQGAIFAIFGDNLGPATIATQPSYPLQTTLAGTAVKVTVGGKTVDAIPIYTTKTQVGVVMPSSTPTGDGTVSVTYNGAVSATHAVTVVPNSFGIFALNQQGSGPAALTDANGGFITLSASAKPGQTIVVWGTGLGPIAGNDAADQSGGDMTSVPVQVYIGGKLASIRYRGRAPHIAGLDQINADIPQGVTGCYASLIVVINGVASNSTTIPVAANGGACSDANGVSSTDLTGLLGKNSATLGFISVGRTVTQSSITLPPGAPVLPGVGGTTKADGASAFFVKYTPQQLTASQGLFRQASLGSCVVNTYTGSASTTTTDPVLPTYLDAGPVITVTGGTTPVQLNRDPKLGFYSEPLPTGTTPLTFIPDAGGTFTFANGSGGADVGALKDATIALGAPIVWSNMDQITDVTRSSDLPITWTGGAAGTYVTITGGTYLTGADASSTVVVSFTCTAPATDHAFTVPAGVLLQLPVSTPISAGGITIPTGSLSVGNYTTPSKFTAPGLDLGYASAYIDNSKSVNYK
jgi:uncharacterized protein (TIGR03437 family)